MNDPSRYAKTMTAGFGNIVEGPMGLAMPESMARAIEWAARALPKDFTYRRRAYSAKQEDVSSGERSEVSVITTDAVDRDGECVLTTGGNWKEYNRVVPFCHEYKKLPAGFSMWVTAKGQSTKAKTQYPTAPPDWSGPWLPSAIWHFITQPIATMGDKSIGFLPLNVRGATAEEKRMRPDLDSVPIIDKWLALEYSCVLIPCNQEAQLEAVGKSEQQGAITKQFADQVRRLIIEPAPTNKTVISMSQVQTDPAAKAAMAEGANASGGAVVGDKVDPMKMSSVKMMMPDHVKAAMKMMGKSIKAEHLHEDGVEDEPAMTIHSSMHGQDAEAVKSLLSDTPPVNCKFGKCKCFGSASGMAGKAMDNHAPTSGSQHAPQHAGGDDPADGQDEQGGDIIGVQGMGIDLHSLHKKLLALPHSDSSAATFNPMVKIATVKKDMGGDYDGMPGLEGLSMKCKSVKFIDGDGKGTDIALAGKPPAKMISGYILKDAGRLLVKTEWPAGNDPDDDGDNDPKIICPACHEEAKMIGNVDVPGIGACDKYECAKCDTSFLVPEQFHRVPDSVSSDGTNQSNAGAPPPDYQSGKQSPGPETKTPAPVTVEEVKALPPNPDILAKAIERRRAELKSQIAATVVPVVFEAIDKRMGKV